MGVASGPGNFSGEVGNYENVYITLVVAKWCSLEVNSKGISLEIWPPGCYCCW